MSSGGVARVGSPAEAVAAIRTYLADPQTDAEARGRMVEQLCHQIDGASAERTAGVVLEQLALAVEGRVS